MSVDDRDLYERFAALRREEEARVPPFWADLQAARERGRRRFAGKLVAATAILAATVAMIAWLHFGARFPNKGLGSGREQAAVSITTWKPATDFLLDTPGREMLQGVPAIGDWHGEVNVPGPGERHRRIRKQVLP